MDFDSLTFNICAFIASLFLLEWGADRFIDHTVIVARRLGVSPVLVSLLTAGAEWEELAVVIAAVNQRPTLALGNIVGSSISNILGAFALGLLFHPGRMIFDKSSKIYSAVLLAVTSIFVAFLIFFDSLRNIAGPFLIALFIGYVLSIAYGIYKGAMSAPEYSDSDSDSDSSSDSASDIDDDISDATLNVNSMIPTIQNDEQDAHLLKPLPKYAPIHDEEAGSNSILVESLSQHQILRKNPARKPNKRPQRLLYHLAQLAIGFLALTISCYVLVHSVATIGDLFALSNSLVGVTVLSIATTLPEKFIAVASGRRGQGGIVVANTAGSNIFLLTLCAGILFISGDKSLLATGINSVELSVVWVTAGVLCLAVFYGADKRVGAALLGLYVVFLITEFTVFHHADID